jgi:hypothetical protein
MKEIDDTIFSKLKSLLPALREVVYGMTIHEMDVELKKEKGNLDRLFLLIIFGDVVGLPLFPPYYSMRLLPFIIPSVRAWKRSLLRDKDLTDLATMDI